MDFRKVRKESEYLSIKLITVKALRTSRFFLCVLCG